MLNNILVRISYGLRIFWDEVNDLTLAVVGLSKQYCLRRTKDDELYCVGKRKIINPKIFCSLDFSFGSFLYIKAKKGTVASFASLKTATQKYLKTAHKFTKPTIKKRARIVAREVRRRTQDAG